MSARVLALATLLLACNSNAPTGPAPEPAVVVPPTKPAAPVIEPPAAPVAPVTPAVPETPTAPIAPSKPPPPIAGVRDKQPLPGMPECLEMYSACSPDGKGGQQCTSASFTLACGQTGKVPGGDTLRCVCP